MNLKLEDDFILPEYCQQKFKKSLKNGVYELHTKFMKKALNSVHLKS